MFTKEKAALLMEIGCKINGESHSHNQFLYIKKGIVYNESDTALGTLNSKYWIDQPNNGWTIFGNN